MELGLGLGLDVRVGVSHLHEHVGQVGLVEDLVVGLRGELAQGLVALLVLAAALGDETHQIVRHVGPHLVRVRVGVGVRVRVRVWVRVGVWVRAAPGEGQGWGWG